MNRSNIEIHVEGDFAWAIAIVEVKVTVNLDGKEIDNRGYETFLFRRIEGDRKSYIPTVQGGTSNS